MPIITGHLADDTLNALYGLADVLVVPRIYEPVGMTALEGMAVSVQVVASEVGGLSEIVADSENGLLVPPGNSRMIAAAGVNQIVSNSTLANSLSRNGRNHAMYFRSDRMVEETCL